VTVDQDYSATDPVGLLSSCQFSTINAEISM